VFAWLIDRLTDPNGNQATFRYRRDGNCLYLEEVTYGSYGVRFTYEERPDPFTDRRPGFPLAYRLRCTRIDMTSRDAPGGRLRHYHLEYDNPQPRGLSLLRRVRLAGGEGADAVEMPPTTLTYAALDLAESRYVRCSADGLPPPDLSAPNVALVDLDGAGLPGVVATGSEGPVYWRNLGDGRWDRPRKLENFPATASLGDARAHFADLEGNGTADLLWGGEPFQGYYPNTAGGQFEQFVRYRNPLAFDPGDARFRLYDLDGDGRADALYSGDKALLAFRNRGSEGWDGEPLRLSRRDAPDFPDVSFDDPHVRLADMTGDGLTDIVRVRSGELVYWPYLGHGQWGDRQEMRKSPVLPRDYDPGRLFLVDVDRDGLSDLVYVEAERVRIWINQDGRSFADPIPVEVPPTAGATVALVDLFGTGRPGLLFSYGDDRPSGRAYRYLALGGGTPPYLLRSIDNGLGAVTTIEYAPSTGYQIADRRAGRPWQSFLPFPLQVVREVRLQDRVTGVSARTQYAYRNGHYDGVDREVRGFALVEEVQHGDDSVPTVVRENEFHSGTDLTLTESGRRELSAARRDELRCQRGSLRRLRVYARPAGNTGSAGRLVEEARYEWAVRTEFEAAAGRVMFPHQTLCEAVFHDPDDPAAPRRVVRVRQAGYDAFGNVTAREHSGGRDDGVFREELFRREEFAYATGPAGGGRIGYLSRVAVRDRAGSLLSLTNYYYDGKPFVGLPFGEVRAGNLARHEDLVLAAGDTLPEALRDANLRTLGYHEAGDPAAGTAGWYRNKSRQEHNPNGTLSRLMDPLGRVTDVKYTPDGLFPVEVRDAAGLVTRAAYDPLAAAISSVTNPSGVAERREYDRVGRVVRVYLTRDDGKEHLARVVRYDHGAFAPGAVRPPSVTLFLCRRLGADPTAVGNPDRPPEQVTEAVVQRTYFSGVGVEVQRLITAEPDPGGATRTCVTGAKWVNVRGRPAGELLPRFGSSYHYLPPGDRPPTDGAFRFKYDHGGRVAEVVAADGTRRRAQVTPWAVTLFDEKDSVGDKPTRTEVLDAWGRPKAVREHPAAGQVLTTSQLRDPVGNLVAVNGEGQAAGFRYGYDRVRRRVLAEHPDAGRRAYLFDAADNLIETVDPRGVRLRNWYDRINRLVRVVRVADGKEEDLRSYVYDKDSGHEEGKGWRRGRLAAVKDESGETRLEYNAAGQVIRKRRTLPDGKVLELAREYDPLGNLTALTYPDKARVEYRYNQANLLEAVPGYVDRIDYNALAQHTAVRYRNGAESRFRYDGRNHRLRDMQVQGRDRPLLLLSYDYDPRGNVTRIREGTGPDAAARTFDYDGLNRLTRDVLSGPAATDGQFEYDPLGNILRNEAGVVGPVRYANTHHPGWATEYRLAGEGAALTATYDEAGNLTARGNLKELEYDAFGRLTRAARKDGVTVLFAYDYQGTKVSRVRQERAGMVAATVYLEDLYEEGPNGAIRYIPTPFGVVAEVATNHGGQEQTLFHHADHLGSTRLLTDGRGAERVRQAYTAFGAVLDRAADLRRFLGREFDPDLGLYHLGARFYDPLLGRFITPDALVLEDVERFLASPQALNLYAYAANNPLRYVDPGGNFFWIVAAIGAIVGAAIGAATAASNGGDLGTILLGALGGAAIGFLTGGLGGAPLLQSAILGAGIGGISALITGNNFWTGVATGFGFGAIGGALGSWSTLIGGQGLWVDVGNIAIEVAKGAAVGGLLGGVSSALQGRDFWGGFTSGLLLGALVAGATVAVFGPRFDPLSLPNVTEKKMAFLYDLKREINKTLWPDGINPTGPMPSVNSIVFRHGGLLKLWGGDSVKGFYFGVKGFSGVFTSGKYMMDPGLLSDELLHAAQSSRFLFGSGELLFRWVLDKHSIEPPGHNP
jgi:RHS repeat-associated protein